MTALEPILFMLFFPLTTYTFRFVSGGFFFYHWQWNFKDQAMSKPSELTIASVISTGNSPIFQSCCILLINADAQIQSTPLYIIVREWSLCVVLDVAFFIACAMLSWKDQTPAGNCNSSSFQNGKRRHPVKPY